MSSCAPSPLRERVVSHVFTRKVAWRRLFFCVSGRTRRFEADRQTRTTSLTSTMPSPIPGTLHTYTDQPTKLPLFESGDLSSSKCVRARLVACRYVRTSSRLTRTPGFSRLVCSSSFSLDSLTAGQPSLTLLRCEMRSKLPAGRCTSCCDLLALGRTWTTRAEPHGRFPPICRAQPHLTSSYKGFGTGTLEGDADQIEAAVDYLKSQGARFPCPRPAQRPRHGRLLPDPVYSFTGKETVVFLGHSTGCQQIMQYLTVKPRSQVARAIIQAPGASALEPSDPQSFADHPIRPSSKCLTEPTSRSTSRHRRSKQCRICTSRPRLGVRKRRTSRPRRLTRCSRCLSSPPTEPGHSSVSGTCPSLRCVRLWTSFRLTGPLSSLALS